MNDAGKPVEICSNLNRASNPMAWHANFRVSGDIAVSSYYWRITMDGENVWRFFPTEMKFNGYGNQVEVSFDITDTGETPVDDASRLRMYLTVFPATSK